MSARQLGRERDDRTHPRARKINGRVWVLVMQVVVVSICHQYIELSFGRDNIPGTNIGSGIPERLIKSARNSRGPAISRDRW